MRVLYIYIYFFVFRTSSYFEFLRTCILYVVRTFAYMNFFICVSILFRFREELLVFEENLSRKSETDHATTTRNKVFYFLRET